MACLDWMAWEGGREGGNRVTVQQRARGRGGGAAVGGGLASEGERKKVGGACAFGPPRTASSRPTPFCPPPARLLSTGKVYWQTFTLNCT